MKISCWAAVNSFIELISSCKAASPLCYKPYKDLHSRATGGEMQKFTEVEWKTITAFGWSRTCEQDPTVEPLNCWLMAFRLRQWIAVTMTAGTECVQADHISEHQVPRGRERRGSYVTGWSTRDTACTLSCQCASVKRKTVSVPGSKWAFFFFSTFKTKTKSTNFMHE